MAAELTTAEMFRQKSGVAKLLGELILVCFKFDQMKVLIFLNTQCGAGVMVLADVET